MKAWLSFFRAVNLPTVPGDVLAGAAAVMVATGCALPPVALAAACFAGVFLYLFGLADNDIVGAKMDVGRPIPEGEISLRAARVARGICLFLVLVSGAAANLPSAWWIVAFALAVSAVVYNRSKNFVVMGLCRGLNVLCGGVAVAGVPTVGVLVCAAVWTAYIAAVTKYSEGEEADPAKKRRVGLLIGGIVYLQVIALLVFYVRPLLVAGAVLIVAFRLTKRMLPTVSAS